MARKRKLPQGLSENSGRYRIQFTSRHTSPGRRYRERLPEGTSFSRAKEYLIHLRERDRLEQLLWPEERAEISARQSEQEYERPSIGEFAESVYLPHCEVRNAPRTVRSKRQLFAMSGPWFWDVPIDQVTPALVHQYQEERKAEGVSDRTVNMGWDTVRSLLNHAHSIGVIESAAPQVKPLKIRDKKPIRCLTEDEADRALQNAANRGPMWHTLVMFLLHTGARWGDARGLCWDDVNFEASIIRLRAKHSKHGKPREIPIHPDLEDCLRSLPKTQELVFVRQHIRTGDWISLREDPRCFGGKYPWEGEEGELRVGAHVFRHTFTYWKLRAKAPIAVVSAYLGHRSIQVTADIYGHIQPVEHPDVIESGPRPRSRRLHVVNE